MTPLDESVIEDAALEWFAQLGYERAYGPNLAPGEVNSERDSFEQVYLYGRLRDAARRINPGIDADLIDAAIKRLERAESQSLIDENARVHKLLTEGVPVEYRATDGSVRTTSLWLIDFEDPDNDDWLVVNQYTIVEVGKHRRPDVMVFVNGLPLGLLELKNLASEDATLKKAQPDSELPHRHPLGVHRQRCHGGLRRHQCGDEFIHRRVRALRPVEDHRRPRGGHRPPRPRGPH